MLKILRKSNWFVSSLIFFTPILMIFFLASQMGYSQVKGKFEAYQAIPEITRLSDLQPIAPGEVVMVRGTLAAATLTGQAGTPDLIVYEEQPAEGREVRYQEKFAQIFPEFIIDLPGGALVIQPSQTRDRVVRDPLHTVEQGDFQYVGFRQGDTITVQGAWQPGNQPRLEDVTGVTSQSKAELTAAWQSAFQMVSWARNGFGGLTLLGIILLIIEFRRSKKQAVEETQPWTTPETTTTATTSPF